LPVYSILARIGELPKYRSELVSVPYLRYSSSWY
jgi:hypothetical protein